MFYLKVTYLVVFVVGVSLNYAINAFMCRTEENNVDRNILFPCLLCIM